MHQDDVKRRIVVEYGSLYVYVYITDGSGKLLDEDRFKQPFRLDSKDVAEEAAECYSATWDWLNETINP